MNFNVLKQIYCGLFGLIKDWLRFNVDRWLGFG
jgi:hypothetical protein